MDKKLQMMTIVGYTKPDFSGEKTTFVAQVNPESFDRSLNFSNDKQQTKNKSGVKASDTTATGESYRFELILDGTGVIDGDGQKDITDKIEEFHNTVTHIDNKAKDAKGNKVEARKPSYVKLFYCNKMFKCCITSVSIKYGLFSLEGYPLRARITCDFKAVGFPTVIDDKERSESLVNSSRPSKQSFSDNDGDVNKTIEDCLEEGKDSPVPTDE